jgi:hypothetical protein
LAIVGVLCLWQLGANLLAKRSHDNATALLIIIGLGGVNAAAWVIARTAMAATKSLRNEG